MDSRSLTFQVAISALSLTGISSSLLLRSPIPLWIVLILGGSYVLWQVGRQILSQDVGADLLAAVSILVAIAMGQYLVACIIVLMLSGGQAIEQYARQHASAALGALAKRAPRIAHIVTGDSVRDAKVDEVVPGAVVRVLPHEICPVDGRVILGHGSMDESYLTGEPFQISKTLGSNVLSGAINGNAALTIEATRLASESRFSQIMRVMQQSQQQRPRLRRIGDRLALGYIPLVLLIAALTWLLTGNAERFLAVLVIATPCPLILAIPVAIIGAISTAANRGIVIKDPKGLEQAGECRTFIFDKTGTLTHGKPKLEEIETAPGFQEENVLAIAASLENYSKHPLAGAVIEAAKEKRLQTTPATEVSELPGHGLQGVVSGQEIRITGRTKTAAAGLSLPPSKPGLECVVLIGGKFAALFRFKDKPREGSEAYIRHLSPRHGATKTLLLSGDRGAEVKYLAGLLGIGNVFYESTPEQKVEVVQHETSLHKTLYLGDGINDAPALMQATVGVAFGKGSDVTAEAADVVILEPSLQKVDEFVHIGKRMRRIALQSALGGMALSSIGMIFAALGLLSPIGGAIAQEAIDLLAILNALRAARAPRKLADF